MKYYYTTRKGTLGDRLHTSRDFDRFDNDQDKIIVTEIGSDYHVLVYQHGEYAEEKKVLGFYELVDFLQENKLNTYFINCNKIRLNILNYDIRTSKDTYKAKKLTPGPEEIYTVNDGKVLRTEAYIDKEVIKDAILESYYKELHDNPDNFKKIDIKDFINNEEAFEAYHLPFIERNGKLLIPRYSYVYPSLFYILSGIYNKKGDKINLSKEDLWNLYTESESPNREIVDKIIDKIEVKIKKSYELQEFESALSFMEEYQKDEFDYELRLRKVRSKLEEAKDNEVLFNDMYLIKDNIVPVLKKETK